MRGDGYRQSLVELVGVTTSVRHVDRGAWLSVDGTRELGVSELWRLVDPAFCDCDVTDFLAEGFVEIGADGTAVEARLAGRCVRCGEEGTTGWVTLGGIVDTDDREFRPVDPDAVQFVSHRTAERDR